MVSDTLSEAALSGFNILMEGLPLEVRITRSAPLSPGRQGEFRNKRLRITPAAMPAGIVHRFRKNAIDQNMGA